MYSVKSLRQPGTLYFYKIRCKKPEVTGEVKKNYRQHEALLLNVAKFMLKEQVREYFGIGEDGEPTANIPQVHDTAEMQRVEYIQVFKGFMQHYRYY